MSGDMSNAEHGIATVDATGARGRLAGGSLDQQQQWSQNTMGERMLGYLLALAIVMLGIIWAIDAPGWIQFSVTTTILFVIGYQIFRFFRARNQLLAQRHDQASAYNNQR